MQTLRRPLHPEVKILDEKLGIVSYVASDETLDSYREVIRADGWRFDHFRKNAPFVDSHDYSTLENQVGKVLDFNVRGKALEETVQWAIDVPENKMAQLGWAMTKAGYLKAVSVGFWPEQLVSKYDGDPKAYQQQLKELGVTDAASPAAPRVIYLRQQQIELSACIIGANPNALAKCALDWAYANKAGVIKDDDVEFLVREHAKRETANSADSSAAAELARRRTRNEFLNQFEQQRKSI
jgi:hypothetical protein